MSIKLPHKSFCILPWVSLEASPTGTVRPCCLADESIIDDDDLQCNLIDDTLEHIQDTKYMRKLRQKFLDGKRPKTCRKCWNEEDAGRTSKRMHTLNRLKHFDLPSKWTNKAHGLMFLDLKLGNICNLKCRICGSWSSSTFAAEELQYVDNPKESFHYDMLRQGRWPRENENFWQNLWDISEGIRYLEFTGGEPFMIKEHFEYLDWLVSNGLAPDIEIHYNTNGTQWPKKEYVKLWTYFKHVEIAFSIDNVGRKFEYERSGAIWHEVNENLEKFFELRNNVDNMSLQLCTTVNVFNVLYLEDVVKWEFFQMFDFVYWNMLHDAPANCIQALPDIVKEEAALRLLSADVPKEVKQEFVNIVTFMNESNGVELADVQKAITHLDQRRKESLQFSHPCLYEMLFNGKTCKET